MPDPVPLVRAVRGGRLEAVHRGSYVLLQDGVVLERAGDPDCRAYYRSTSKPFQAMAAVTTGAADRFGLTPAMLALGAGSHNAEPRHLATLREMLSRLGLDEGALGCGGHWSIDPETARRQAAEHGPLLDPLPRAWSNCSGNHAVMLAAARGLDAPASTYLDAAHPAQVEITRLLALCCDVGTDEIGIGVDGCGAPAHEVALDAVARSLAHLGDPHDLPEDVAAAARRIGAAMSAHPEMVAGLRRFDTDLMTTASTRLIAKAGAEGIHGLVVPERKLALAIKVEDGHDRGYRLVVIELLRRYGVLREEEAAGLAERHGRTVCNRTGVAVGRLEVVV
jgi:L-asparaginase II